ncbi:nuclear transport factor 2 family protein [Sphingomonas jatrophae]|uniref:SnoaL-like domain-containing protein n=1 Tax=Sphingomonas jatrophae TaxID=1166337 RepID=A0A1I6M519_9SPHN|nr:nuclear transport factor 2 family protein [Sphingomonas jatrophae]SFS10632.1 SnoaL-like domain-containing protein [Sphingomonas jatrophae]
MLFDAYTRWRELTPDVERERTTLDAKVQYLTDKLRIQEMINEYAFACDSRRWDVLERLYDEDIERVMTGTLDETVRGRANLIGLHAKPALPRREGVVAPPRDLSKIEGLEIRHLIGTQVVRIGDDDRSAWALCHYQMALVGQEAGEWQHGLHEGTYLFTFSKARGDWRFVRHEIWTNNAANPMFSDPRARKAQAA